MEATLCEERSEDPSRPTEGSSEGDEQDVEDPDLALARLLQSQEAAYMMLRNASMDSSSTFGRDGARQVEDLGTDRNVEEGEVLDDEDVARRIQEQEEREFQLRMMAMAGISFRDHEDSEEEEGAADPTVGRTREPSTVETDNMSYEQLLELQEMIGHESRGASQRSIDSLRVSSFEEICSSSDGNGIDQDLICAICRSEYDEDDQLKILKCKHFYHTECIVRWLNINKACPVCNREVNEEDDH